MSDLVTHAAKEAAWNDYTFGGSLDEVLNAAAPHIAAQALRQAAKMVGPGDVRHAAAISSFGYGDLMRLAAEYEDTANFTGLVQLGQEIEGEATNG